MLDFSHFFLVKGEERFPVGKGLSLETKDIGRRME